MARILLLLPSSTYRAADFIDAAAQVDAEVVIASDAEQAMAPEMGDRSLTLPLRDPDEAAAEIVRHAERAPIDAIVAVDDQGVVPAAIASRRLGLPHNPPDAVRATRDKAELRRRLAGQVPQPGSAVVGPEDDVATIAAGIGFPVVVKPLGLSASRGVIRADDREAASAAAKRVRTILDCADHDPGEDLLVERFVPGDEVAVEGLLRDGELEILAVFDKPDPLDGPYFEETIYVTPSRHPTVALQDVVRVTGTAAAAIGLREGPVHAELRLRPTGNGGIQAVFLELAARSIGGLCARSLRFGLGVSLEEVIVRHALGLELDTLRRDPDPSGVMMLPIPRAGRLVAVDGRERARDVPGVVGLEITVPPGREVEPLPEGDRYLGFLFARGGTPADVEEALRTAHSLLEVHIEDG